LTLHYLGYDNNMKGLCKLDADLTLSSCSSVT